MKILIWMTSRRSPRSSQVPRREGHQATIATRGAAGALTGRYLRSRRAFLDVSMPG